MPTEWLSVHLNTSAFVHARRPYLSLLLKQRRHLLSWDVERILESRKPYDASLAAVTALKQQLGLSRVESPFVNPSEGTTNGDGETETETDADKETVSLTAAQNATQNRNHAVRKRALEVIDE